MFLERLGKHPNLGLLILRAGIGIALLSQNYHLLLGGTPEWRTAGQTMTHIGIHFALTAWGFLIASALTIGSGLLILGWQTRGAAVAITLATVLHFAPQIKHPTELLQTPHALILLSGILSLIILGAGKYSVDGR